MLEPTLSNRTLSNKKDILLRDMFYYETVDSKIPKILNVSTLKKFYGRHGGLINLYNGLFSDIYLLFLPKPSHQQIFRGRLRL